MRPVHRWRVAGVLAGRLSQRHELSHMPTVGAPGSATESAPSMEHATPPSWIAAHASRPAAAAADPAATSCAPASTPFAASPARLALSARVAARVAATSFATTSSATPRAGGTFAACAAVSAALSAVHWLCHRIRCSIHPGRPGGVACARAVVRRVFGGGAAPAFPRPMWHLQWRRRELWLRRCRRLNRRMRRVRASCRRTEPRLRRDCRPPSAGAAGDYVGRSCACSALHPRCVAVPAADQTIGATAACADRAGTARPGWHCPRRARRPW